MTTVKKRKMDFFMSRKYTYLTMADQYFVFPGCFSKPRNADQVVSISKRRGLLLNGIGIAIVHLSFIFR
jgi:hypothetical protein